MIRPQAEWRIFRALTALRGTTLAEREQERVPVLAARVMAGTSVGSLPFFEQYFVGGVNNLRGYAEDRFWGKNMAIANVELRYPLFASLVGVAFVDAGQAWGSEFRFQGTGFSTEFQQSRQFGPRLGAGVGVRYLTPLGPLRLDFAVGDSFRTHFTLGQTF